MSESKKSNPIVWRKNLDFKKRLVVALQHILTMFPGTVAVPIILGNALSLDSETTAILISANFLTSGLGILIQTIGFKKKIGSKLPIMMGSAFVTLGPMIVIGQEYGILGLIGSVIGSGVVLFLMTSFISKIIGLFSDTVIACFTILLGMSLTPTALNDLAGGQGAADFGSSKNLLLGLFVVIVIILVERYGKGAIKSLSLLVGIGVGIVAGLFLGMIDLSVIGDAKAFEIATPLKFGIPEFHIGPIVIMTIFSIINVLQCIGVFAVLDRITGETIEEDTKIAGIRGLALSQMLSGLLNGVPLGMYSQNTSVLIRTKVKDVQAVSIAGVILVLLGIFPKIAAILIAIPKPVLGGVTLVLAGSILTGGILTMLNIDFSKQTNITIVGLSLAVGAGVIAAPGIFKNLPQTLEMLLSNALFMSSMTAILLEYALNRKVKD